MAASPDPRPRKRIKDPDLLKQMHLEGGVCAVDGCEETWNLELDHIIRRSQGGDDSPENLRWLCNRHHRDLHDGRLHL